MATFHCHVWLPQGRMGVWSVFNPTWKRTASDVTIQFNAQIINSKRGTISRKKIIYPNISKHDWHRSHKSLDCGTRRVSTSQVESRGAAPSPWRLSTSWAELESPSGSNSRRYWGVKTSSDMFWSFLEYALIYWCLWVSLCWIHQAKCYLLLVIYSVCGSYCVPSLEQGMPVWHSQ